MSPSIILSNDFIAIICVYIQTTAPTFFFLLDYFLKDCWHTMKTYTTWECPVINNFVKDWIWIAFWSFKHVFFFCWYKFCLIISINVSIEHIKLIAWASFKKKTNRKNIYNNKNSKPINQFVYIENNNKQQQNATIFIFHWQ